ncbi:hypothetical protein ACJJTC_012894 [Scirpophaga incertulas]
MVQLKQVSLRLKSITNIQKITKTMKMVSASKFTKAERELHAARPFGYGPRKFYESSQLVKAVEKGKEQESKDTPPITPNKPADKEGKQVKRLYIAITSDRGLCGGVHSGIARRVRREVTHRAEAADNAKLVCVGDKSRAMLRRVLAPQMLISVKDIGRISPVFADASLIAAAIADAGYTFDSAELIEAAPNINAFDEVDGDELTSYAEWTSAALLFYALKENAASEQSARMAAMDNATKNAAEMIRKLTLLFNRTRQAVITRELIEIISGAAALK